MQRPNNTRTLDVIVTLQPLPTPAIVDITEYLVEDRDPKGYYARIAVCNLPKTPGAHTGSGEGGLTALTRNSVRKTYRNG